MPYIKPEDRDRADYEISIDANVQELSDAIKWIADDDNTKLSGLCNYTITQLLAKSLKGDGWRYDKINTAIGVLECAKLEMYRRLAAPYEDNCIQKNGDISEYEDQCSNPNDQHNR